MNKYFTKIEKTETKTDKNIDINPNTNLKTNLNTNPDKEKNKYILFDSDEEENENEKNNEKRVFQLFGSNLSINNKKQEKEELVYNLNDYSLIHWRPMLDELDFKMGLYENLGDISIEEMPNLVFYGCKGSGKTTKIHALLASLFGRNIYNIKNMQFEEDRKIIQYRLSNYHIEFSSTEMNSNEKIFIHSFLKIFIQTKNVALNIPKIVYIHHAEKLSKQSQLALRRMIEVHYTTSRFIFEINDIGMLAGPLTSRCLPVRISMPSKDEITKCLKNTSSKYGVSIKDVDIENIFKSSTGYDNLENVSRHEYDLKKIFGCYYTFIYTGKIFSFYEYNKLDEIIQIIEKKKCNVTSMEKVRDTIQDLYIRLIPMNFCIQYIFNKLTKKYSNNEKVLFNIISITTKCDHLLKQGNKESLHIEYYIFSLCEYIQNVK